MDSVPDFHSQQNAVAVLTPILYNTVSHTWRPDTAMLPPASHEDPCESAQTAGYPNLPPEN